MSTFHELVKKKLKHLTRNQVSSVKNKKKVLYESEKKFEKIMNSKGVELIPYPKRFMVFELVRPTHYTPDFQVYGSNVYYEVSNGHAVFELNRRKYDSFRELYPKLTLINVKPNGDEYVQRIKKRRYNYKEKTYYNKKYDEIMPL